MTKDDLVKVIEQMVFEVLENSIEEAEEGYCTKVEISLLPDNVVKIVDDGRGIPLESDGIVQDETLNNILAGAPITAMEYSQMGDLPLDSLKVVNSLCERLTVKVYRGGKCYQQDYIRGVAQHEIICAETNCPHGMEIVMKPDTVIFEDISFNKEKIQEWMQKNTHKFLDFVIRGR